MLPAVRARRPTPAGPARIDAVDGLAHSLWLPAGEPLGGVVIVHGAGSCKESHHDFARACRNAGFAAVAYDQRGHGESGGRLDAHALDDVATIAQVLPPGPLALRGSSLGGWAALCAAQRAGADAVVAICPATGAGLARGVRAGTLGFDADHESLLALLSANEPADAAARLEVPVLLLHAEGDDQVPVAHSREIAAGLRHPRSRLIAVPGGHHRSVQHDAELQGEVLRFLRRAFAATA